jgi:hypothetical protein
MASAGNFSLARGSEARRPSRRTIRLCSSCLNSCTQSAPAGGLAASVGMQGGDGHPSRISTRFAARKSPECRPTVPELRIVPPLYPENDVTAYIVVEDFGHLGRAFRETDLAEADPATIVRNMISGEYGDPLRVVAFNTAEGCSRDVSEEVAYDVLDRAYDADTTLSAGAKRFIDRHVTPGAKRPPAPSVLREQVEAARKKA